MTQNATGAILYGAGGATTSAVPIINDGTNNRLAVNALIANPALATVAGQGLGTLNNTVRVALKTSGGSISLETANGTAAAPVTFFYQADATARVTLYELNFLISATSIRFNEATFLNRDSLGALTNGVQVQSVIGGVTTTHATLKLNEDFVSQLNNTGFDSYIASSSVLLASHIFTQPLTAGSTDKIQVLVRDNLNTLLGPGILSGSQTYTFQAYVSGVKG